MRTEMQTWVALLRGVNVGTAKRVPMAEFKAILGELGFHNIATLLNSGNAVFHASAVSGTALSHTLHASLSSHFKFDVPVIVKSWQELQQIVAENALAASAADHSRLLCALTQQTEALANLASLEKLKTPAERFQLGRHAAFLDCANGIRDSQAAKALLGKMGPHVTTRNWATVLKLHALAQQCAG